MSEQSGAWQPDPFGRHQYRYWDGSEWTDQVSNDGAVSTDPAVADPGAGATAASGTPAEPAEPAAPAASEPSGWAPPAPDATAAMPAAAAAPPPGGGYAPPPTPAGEPPSGGGSSNLPGIIVGLILVLLLVGAAVWFFVLSGDDTDDADLIALLRDDMGLTSSQAECVVDELDGVMSASELRRMVESDGEDVNPQHAIAYGTAMLECTLGGVDDDDDDTTTTTGDDATDTTGPGAGGFNLPPAMVRMMADELSTEMGITSAQAECLLTGLFEDFSDEQFESLLTDPDSLGDIGSFGAMAELFDRCDIDPSELDPGSGPSGGGSGFEEGFTYGDNSTLDALWDACEAGSGQACDDLYFNSDFGTEYEEFGDTCGGRFEAGMVLCADEMD